MEASNQEFLRALHEEKIRTQTERADYMTRKLAFITVLFGLSSMNLGIPIADFCWLLFFVPLVAICYDLYIMSADSRIKRIGAFLGRHPSSIAGERERQWENFCVSYRDDLSPSANMFFSIIVTLSAAVFIQAQPITLSHQFKVLFASWLVISIMVIAALWLKHKDIIQRIGKYGIMDS